VGRDGPVVGQGLRHSASRPLDLSVFPASECAQEERPIPAGSPRNVLRVWSAVAPGPVERPSARASRSREIAGYLNRLEGRLADLDRSMMLAWWKQYAGISSAGTGRWDAARARLVGRDELLHFLRDAQTHPHPAELSRRLELFRRIAEDALVEQHPSVASLRARLIKRVFAFRPRWEGRPSTGDRVREVLRYSDDRQARKKAYLALQKLEWEVQPGLVQLIKARNARARELGYRSFMDFRLQAEHLSIPRLENFIHRVLAAARTVSRRFRDQFEARSRESGFFPWDVSRAGEGQNPFPVAAFGGGTMVRDCLWTIRSWGFRGPARPFRIVRRSIPIGGMTLAIELPTDVRVAVNPKGGWLHYDILLHEFGHAVQDWYTRGATHVLRGPENIPGFSGFHEGVGAFFERIPSLETWLRTRPRATEELIQTFRENRRDEELRQAAWNANWTWKEIQLYNRPSADLGYRFHRADRAALNLDESPVGPYADSFWIEAAFYSKNYLIASLVAAHLRQAVREQVRGPFWPNRGVIPWLARTWFRHGALYDWVPRMGQVTGRPFGVASFLDRQQREE
jgi:Peptidase family M3